MKAFMSALFLIFCASYLFAEEAGTIAEAKKLATKINKPILIDFWSDN